MNLSDGQRRILLGIVVICAMLPFLALADYQRGFGVAKAALRLLPPASSAPADQEGDDDDEDPAPAATPVIELNGPLPGQPGASGLMGNYCVAAGGVGLYAVPAGDFTLEIAGAPVAAYVYWSARYPGPQEGDAQIVLEINDGDPIEITPVESYVSFQGPTSTIYRHYYTYRSGDVTELLHDVAPGPVTVRASSLKTGEAHGVSMVVVYEDSVSCPLSSVDLHFGLDSLRYGFGHPYGPNSDVTCVNFAPAASERNLETWLLVGGVESALRKNAIWVAVGAGAGPDDLIGSGAGIVWDGPPTTANFPLTGNAGDTGGQLDVYRNALPIPPGASYACFQIESLDDAIYPDTGISAVWYGMAVGLPQAPAIDTPTPSQTPVPPTPTLSDTPIGIGTLPPLATDTPTQLPPPPDTPGGTPIGIGTLPPLATDTPIATPVPKLAGVQLALSASPAVLTWPQQRAITFQLQVANQSGRALDQAVLWLKMAPAASAFVHHVSGMDGRGWHCALDALATEFACQTRLDTMETAQADRHQLTLTVGDRLPASLASLDVALQLSLAGVVQEQVGASVPLVRTRSALIFDQYMPLVVR